MRDPRGLAPLPAPGPSERPSPLRAPLRSAKAPVMTTLWAASPHAHPQSSTPAAQILPPRALDWNSISNYLVRGFNFLFCRKSVSGANQEQSVSTLSCMAVPALAQLRDKEMVPPEPEQEPWEGQGERRRGPCMAHLASRPMAPTPGNLPQHLPWRLQDWARCPRSLLSQLPAHASLGHHQSHPWPSASKVSRPRGQRTGVHGCCTFPQHLAPFWACRALAADQRRSNCTHLRKAAMGPGHNVVPRTHRADLYTHRRLLRQMHFRRFTSLWLPPTARPGIPAL